MSKWSGGAGGRTQGSGIGANFLAPKSTMFNRIRGPSWGPFSTNPDGHYTSDPGKPWTGTGQKPNSTP